MSKPAAASRVTDALCERLSNIQPRNGFNTELKRVYRPKDMVPDKPVTPYALVRAASDSRTSSAAYQATRERTFEIEVVFSKACDEGELDAAHVDVLRALGIGQDLPERKFNGLIEGEDEAEFRWARQGETTHSIIIRLGVMYVETYN